MQVLVRGNMQKGFIACVVTEDTDIFIANYSNPIEAIQELQRRMFRGRAQISVMFQEEPEEDEQHEWQVLNEVSPTNEAQANAERKSS